MDLKLELVVLPVTDVDRAKAFYMDQMGLHPRRGPSCRRHVRVVQLTPPGSACSITIGTGVSRRSTPGAYQGLHLVVPTSRRPAPGWSTRRRPSASPSTSGPDGQTPGVASAGAGLRDVHVDRGSRRQRLAGPGGRPLDRLTPLLPADYSSPAGASAGAPGRAGSARRTCADRTLGHSLAVPHPGPHRATRSPAAAAIIEPNPGRDRR